MSVDFQDPPTLNVSSANISFLGVTSEFGYDVVNEISGPIRGSQTIIEGDNILDLSAVVPPPELGGSTFSRSQTEMMLLGVALCRLFFMTFMCSLRFPHHMTKYLIIWEGGTSYANPRLLYCSK